MEQWEEHLEAIEKEYPGSLNNWTPEDWKTFIKGRLFEARLEARQRGFEEGCESTEHAMRANLRRRLGNFSEEECCPEGDACARCKMD